MTPAERILAIGEVKDAKDPAEALARVLGVTGEGVIDVIRAAFEMDRQAFEEELRSNGVMKRW